MLCLSQSPSLGAWIIDSCATDHVFGNLSLLSSFIVLANLPFIIIANGS